MKFGFDFRSLPQFLFVDKYTNSTTYSATYTSLTSGSINVFPAWLRIEDDNTNRKCSFSTDGQNWIVFHTVGRTDFLTADEVGFFVDSNTTSLAPAMNLLSWKES